MTYRIQAKGWRLGAAIMTIAVYASLGGCAAPTQYKNVSNPAYSMADYKKDFAECQRGNVKLVQTGGYDDTTKAIVDENAVSACIANKGWRPVAG